MSNWFSTGLAGMKKFKEMESLRAITANQSRVRRFRLKPGEKAKIIFLDHPSLWLQEHTVKVNGNYENYTCTDEIETCPLCMANVKRSPILVSTIIDCRKVTSEKTGKVYQFQKALYVAKGKAIRAMLRQFLEANKLDLTHYAIDVERDTDPKSVSCGEFFTEDKKIAVSALDKIAAKVNEDPKDAKEYLKPFDYMTILAPLPNSDLRRIVGLGEPLGGDSSSELEGLGFSLEDSPEKEELDELGIDDDEDEKIKVDTQEKAEESSTTSDKKTKTETKTEDDDPLF